MTRHPAMMAFFFVLLGIPLFGAAGAPIRIEAESYYEWYDNPYSADHIQVHSCTGASGGYGVDGVTCDGEWIKIYLVLPDPFSFFVKLRSAASVGYVRTFGIRFLADDGNETPVAGDTLVTVPGLGIT